MLQIEHRANTRVLADCPAHLRLPSGDRSGRILNISEGGVRLQLPDPPRKGTMALLEWRGYEAFCKVVWSDGDACGLAFERQVSPSVVTATSGQRRELGAAGAVFGNNRLGNRPTFGTKRS